MGKQRHFRHSLLEEIKGHSHNASLMRAAIAWLIWRIFLTAWGILVWSSGWVTPDAGREWLHGLVPSMDGLRGALVDIWMRWDTVQYLRIIQDGYAPDDRSAYFPLYPVLGKGVGWLLGGENLLGLLIVSNLAALGAFYLLDRLALQEWTEDKVSSTLISVVFYPASFFLFTAYPQSLVLFLSLAAYLAARNGRHWVSLLFSIAAGLTHSMAIPLVALLIIRPLLVKKRRWASFLPAVGPLLSVLGFMLWRAYMGYPSISDLIGSVWGRQIGLSIAMDETMTPMIWLARGWHNLLVLVIGLLAVRWALRKKKTDWAFFLLASLGIPILSAPGFEPLEGLARYALVGFPIFFALSEWIPRGRVRVFLLGLAVGANMFLSGLFMLWGFVG